MSLFDIFYFLIAVAQAGIDVSLLFSSILLLLNLLLFRFWVNMLRKSYVQHGASNSVDYYFGRALGFSYFLVKSLLLIAGVIVSVILLAQVYSVEAIFRFSSPENASFDSIRYGKYVSIGSLFVYFVQLLDLIRQIYNLRRNQGSHV